MDRYFADQPGRSKVLIERGPLATCTMLLAREGKARASGATDHHHQEALLLG